MVHNYCVLSDICLGANVEINVHAKAEKSIKKAPKQVQTKFMLWIKSLEELGMAQTRKVKGWHDEPLKGEKKGIRSIRLNKQWRLEYIYDKEKIEIVWVQDIHPHTY